MSILLLQLKRTDAGYVALDSLGAHATAHTRHATAHTRHDALALLLLAKGFNA